MTTAATSSAAVADPPLPAADSRLDFDASPVSDDLYFVMWKATEKGMWRVYILDDGSQAVAMSLADAERQLTRAKKHVASCSKSNDPNRVAAVSLRIARSVAEEL